MKNKYLVFLRWPEPCFRANEKDLEYLRSLLPRNTVVVEAKTERAFLAELPTATHAIVWYFREEWLKLAPKLKVLATPAAGRELVPQTPITHFGGFHGAIMSETVLAFVMAWSRGFMLKQPSIWPRTWMGDKCREVAGSKAVILGYGRVGQAIGEKLEAVGVEVHGFSRHIPLTVAKLKALAPDWMILALPGDTGTDNIVDAAFLSKLPRKCVLINVGRGNSVDEKALAKALKAGRLAGAYLDVLKYEPHYKRCNGFMEATKRESEEYLQGKVKNCTILPHAAAFSPSYVKRCFKELKDEGLL